MSSRKKRRKVALFCDGGFLAHATRTLEVGQALKRLYGYEVVFCSTGSYTRLMREAGFAVRPVYTEDREVTLALARRAGLVNFGWWRDVAEKSVDSDMAAIRELNPDVVVGDMRLSLSTSAEALGVPCVGLTNAAWTSRFAEPIHVPEGHMSERILGNRLAEKLFPHLKKMIVWYWARGFDRLRKRLGLKPLQTMYQLVEGDITLLADLPEYFPIAETSTSDFRHIGPIRFRAALPRPIWLPKIDKNRPTLYFTMGSTGDTHFFNEAVRVFGGSAYQVLITTAGLPVEQMRRHDNVFIEELADGDSLMSVSHVAITHGGNGTVYQALAHGVPVLGIPTLFDQEINLQRVEALGAGLRLARRDYCADRLRDCIERMISQPSFAASAHRLGQRMGQYDAPRTAAIHIDHFLETGDRFALPPQLNTPRPIPAVTPPEGDLLLRDIDAAPPEPLRQRAR
jgi:UDP:flavonoid glycosyltransferase YjiC (YdhE family)